LTFAGANQQFKAAKVSGASGALLQLNSQLQDALMHLQTQKSNTQYS
jgi:hypothetical protein